MSRLIRMGNSVNWQIIASLSTPLYHQILFIMAALECWIRLGEKIAVFIKKLQKFVLVVYLTFHHSFITWMFSRAFYSVPFAGAIKWRLTFKHFRYFNLNFMSFKPVTYFSTWNEYPHHYQHQQQYHCFHYYRHYPIRHLLHLHPSHHH